MNKNKKILLLFGILIFFLLILLYYYFYFSNSEKISILSIKNNNNDYLVDLETRLAEVNYNIDDIDGLKYKLGYIDQMYKDGLIKSTEETFYLVEKNCKKKVCFSVRETYLFNFNFPIYEG